MSKQHTDLEWHEIFRLDGKRTSLALFEETATGTLDIVQTNDEGESITTRLESGFVTELITSLVGR
jgi:hypothetical protein